MLYAEGEKVQAASAAVPAPASAAAGLQPAEVILPKVDMDMTHGTLAIWHVAEGEMVQRGAALFDIETDKAAMEVEAPATGRLHHITAQVGDKVPVGSTLAWIYPDGMAAGQAPVKQATAPVPEAVKPPVAATDVVQPVQLPQAMGQRATPAARKIARDNAVMLAEVTGTGPLGRVQQADVQAQIAARTAPPVTDMPAPTGWAHDSGPLHISRRAGQGKPIVLLHGFAADSQSWAPLEKALGPTAPLLRIDLAGHGKSPKRQVSSFQDLSRMVVETFDEATRDGQAVHLVGHSLGAALALALADIRARRIASLTLIAPAGLGPDIDAAALNGIVRASRVESLAPWLRRLTATPEGISDDYARAAMRARADGALRACQADMAQALFPDGVQAFDLRAALKRADLPLQIIWGRKDHIVPFAQAVQADGEFALHLLSGAGHIPQIECPDRVARIIHQMIRSVEPVG
ncbi:MAG: acetoin dehydrogenase dihydrolipoyllysine-residue acetyltransferase subunit [Rhodobacteraceae bacterium]|nr:acetoin dehydrogenase dihydrolipoyllysine-residue acetyltransferase subunit [Paracoccaceae bacterium]